MAHIGIFCPPLIGHLNPMLSLGNELLLRQNKVTLFGFLDSQVNAELAEINFSPLGEQEYPLGAIPTFYRNLGKLKGLDAIKYTVQGYRKWTLINLHEGTTIVKRSQVDLLLVDHSNTEGSTIAEYLDIPFISVANALMLNQEKNIPPIVTPWMYQNNWLARWRNQLGYALANLVGSPLQRVVNEQRKNWNLPVYSHVNQTLSPFAQLSQQPKEFEFPRQELPTNFYFTGPYHNKNLRQKILFPYEKLTEQPLIYASLGTLQNQMFYLFRMIAEACHKLDVQLVISLGGAAQIEDFQLPGEPILVRSAPQLDLLPKAALTITHGGLNTVLESLSYGVPMIAIPITNDQPGVAARIAWTGTGEIIPLSRVNVFQLRLAIKKILTDSSYRLNCVRLQKAIEQAGGVSQAADVVEGVISAS